jgi:RNA recognition motif-containing protein
VQSLTSASSFHKPTEKNQIKLFVGGLPFATEEQDLFDYFGSYGKVEKYVVMRDRVTQKKRGFGFVLISFTSEGEA